MREQQLGEEVECVNSDEDGLGCIEDEESRKEINGVNDDEDGFNGIKDEKGANVSNDGSNGGVLDESEKERVLDDDDDGFDMEEEMVADDPSHKNIQCVLDK